MVQSNVSATVGYNLRTQVRPHPDDLRTAADCLRNSTVPLMHSVMFSNSGVPDNVAYDVGLKCAHNGAGLSASAC